MRECRNPVVYWPAYFQQSGEDFYGYSLGIQKISQLIEMHPVNLNVPY